MAFAITNRAYQNSNIVGVPAAHKELADQTATITTVDSTVSTLTTWRIRVYVKTFGTLTTGDTFLATLQVGTGAALTNAINAEQVNITVITGDTALVFDFIGSLATGSFQSWKITFTAASSHTFTADILADFA